MKTSLKKQNSCFAKDQLLSQKRKALHLQKVIQLMNELDVRFQMLEELDFK